jgi:hypothetical protein
MDLLHSSEHRFTLATLGELLALNSRQILRFAIYKMAASGGAGPQHSTPSEEDKLQSDSAAPGSWQVYKIM